MSELDTICSELAEFFEPLNGDIWDDDWGVNAPAEFSQKGCWRRDLQLKAHPWYPHTCFEHSVCLERVFVEWAFGEGHKPRIAVDYLLAEPPKGEHRSIVLILSIVFLEENKEWAFSADTREEALVRAVYEVVSQAKRGEA